MEITNYLGKNEYRLKLAWHLDHWLNYLMLGMVTNAFIWGSALLYLKVKHPSYTSEWSITLPASASLTNISLPNVGQAYSQSQSPYASASQDPRENYKFLVGSEPVLKIAANKSNMLLEKFGTPRVKIVDNTTIMKFELNGTTPEEAQKKSLALYETLQAKLNELRTQEIAQQDVGLQVALASSQTKLKTAQKRLAEYKASSGLSSSEQLSNLSLNIEQLRKQRAQVTAEQQQTNARIRQLSTNLNQSTQQAADGFILQTDPVFQKYLQDYSEANGALVILKAKFLPDHPAVVQEQAKQDASQTALLSRGQSLLRRPVTQQTLDQLNTKSSTSGREALSQQLVTAQADQKGLQAQGQALDQQVVQLEARLKILAQQEFSVEDLKRDVQTAEAVFSSTLAKLDIGKSNIFGSYPQIQILTEPSLPDTPISPKKQLVLGGAALGSLFSTTGIFLLWRRQSKKKVADQTPMLMKRRGSHETSEL